MPLVKRSACRLGCWHAVNRYTLPVYLEARLSVINPPGSSKTFFEQLSLLSLVMTGVCHNFSQVKTGSLVLQGHPPELSDSVKLLLSDAKRHGFEIDHVLKSIDWHFLCKNFSHFGQVVCLLRKFEVTQVFYHFTDCPSEIQNSACIHVHFFLLFMP